MCRSRLTPDIPVSRGSCPPTRVGSDGDRHPLGEFGLLCHDIAEDLVVRGHEGRITKLGGGSHGQHAECRIGEGMAERA
jgi:hypothetical protein